MSELLRCVFTQQQSLNHGKMPRTVTVTGLTKLVGGLHVGNDLETKLVLSVTHMLIQWPNRSNASLQTAVKLVLRCSAMSSEMIKVT